MRFPGIGLTAAWLAATVALVGCVDNSREKDTVSPTVGDERAVPFVPDDFVPGLETRPRNQRCTASNFSGLGSVIGLEQVFPRVSLDQPVDMIQASDGRWYIAQREGVILVVNDAAGAGSVAGDLRDRVNSEDLEQGLLGIALHPDFPEVPELYVSYTGVGGRSTISAFTVRAGRVDPDSERIILTQDQPYGNHNGGHIAFGPDGYLYIGFGDGGYGDDPHGNGQNTGNWLGAMLRIDVGQSPYGIPADNPFSDSPACGAASSCPEIWAWGFRNPWRWSFDRQTGELWLADVGQDAWEEVDVVTAGGNYGWRCYEGNHAFNTEGCGVEADYTFPVAEYGHDQGRSITGGYVYRGKQVPGIAGLYLYADFVSGDIWGLNTARTGAKPVRLLAGNGHNIASFAEGRDGELYVIDFNGGIYRIVEGEGAPVETPALKLSETGCVDPADPKSFVSGVIHYEVNARLWSDSAEKWRGFALPEGKTITVDESGDWHFPAGSVLVKDFRVAGQRVETRFLVNRSGHWAGYSFAWNEQGTDAELVTQAQTRIINGLRWDYPAGQCFECHTQAVDITLGPENQQLNKEAFFPATGIRANQLGTFASIGLLSVSTATPLDRLPALVDPLDENASLASRARSYLHANCSGCHRPFSNGRGTLDMRAQTRLADLGGCGVPASFGRAGSRSGLLIAPGDGADSVLVRRMASEDPALRMPPLGTRQVDEAGVAVVREWIDALQGCP